MYQRIIPYVANSIAVVAKFYTIQLYSIIQNYMGYKQFVFHTNMCILNHFSDCGQNSTSMHLCMYVGAAEYTRLFTELHTDFLDVLHAFPSCQPPLERLIGQLSQ